MTETEAEIVLIRTAKNDLNLFSLLLADYPGGGPPKVGDFLPLIAERRLGVSVDKEGRPLMITYLCGLYEVVEVRHGTGYDLAPDLRNSKVVGLRSRISGYGIRLGPAMECPIEMELLIPQIQYAPT